MFFCHLDRNRRALTFTCPVVRFFASSEWHQNSFFRLKKKGYKPLFAYIIIDLIRKPLFIEASFFYRFE